jgi:hypothetical protein
MPPIDEPASFEPKASRAGGRKAKTAASAAGRPAGPELVAVTVDAATGRIVTIEGVDAAGARRELSAEEKTRLSEGREATLERVVEQAFLAGIDCVLGDSGGEEEPEAGDEAELSRILLRSLIERSAAGRLLQRDILSRAIIGTLIAQAAGARAAAH